MNKSRIGIIKFLRCVRRWTEMDGFRQKKSASILGLFWTQTRILDARNLSWVLIVGLCVRPLLFWIQNAKISWVKMAVHPSVTQKTDLKTSVTKQQNQTSHSGLPREISRFGADLFQNTHPFLTLRKLVANFIDEKVQCDA